jgi:hypothetical protein
MILNGVQIRFLKWMKCNSLLEGYSKAYLRRCSCARRKVFFYLVCVSLQLQDRDSKYFSREHSHFIFFVQLQGFHIWF